MNRLPVFKKKARFLSESSLCASDLVMHPLSVHNVSVALSQLCNSCSKAYLHSTVHGERCVRGITLVDQGSGTFTRQPGLLLSAQPCQFFKLSAFDQSGVWNVCDV